MPTPEQPELEQEIDKAVLDIQIKVERLEHMINEQLDTTQRHCDQQKIHLIFRELQDLVTDRKEGKYRLLAVY